MLLVTGAGWFCGADYFGITVEAKLCNCHVCVAALWLALGESMALLGIVTPES